MADLISPPGYGRVIPFDKDRHRGLGVPARAPFGAGLNAVYLTSTEFILASRSYPIVLVRDPAGFCLPMIVTGLASGQNLFVDEQGFWDETVYVPAYARRYPFCVAELPQQKDNRLICVDEAVLDAHSPALFDRQGRPTKEWKKIEKFIADLETARQHTERLTRALDELDLLEAFEAQAVLKSGGEFRLKSMHRVNEDRLNALPGDVIRELMAQGDLSRIYAHLMSLDNFRGLLERSAKLAARA